MSNPQHQAGGPSIAARILWVFFSINGRIGREVYWLAWFAIYAATVFVAEANSMKVTIDWDKGWFDFEPRNVATVLFVVSTALLVCVSVKRLHDLNASGFFALAVLIFPINVAATILLGVLPGKPGPNRYGDRADVPPPPAGS